MNKNNYTVLYVEDDTGVRNNMSEALVNRCNKVIAASNGEEAYTLYKDKKPDFIITDIEMPKMDGLELIEKIRKDNLEIPIIVLSAYTEKEKLMRAIKLDLVDYIQKPSSRVDLKDAIDSACKKLQKNEKNLLNYDDILEAIFVLDANAEVQECNNECLSMFGYENKAEFIGLSVEDIFSFKGEHTNKLNTQNKFAYKEVYLKRKDKTLFMAKTQSKLSIQNNKKVNIVSVINLSEVIKEHISCPLTKLQTRKTLEIDFENMMKRHRMDKESACAIFIDIDNFKHINDNYGHQIGDDVIESIAKTLLQSVRNNDIVVRWGGDEFMVLLLNTEIAQGRKIANNLRLNIKKIKIDTLENITCSIGLDAIDEMDTLSDVTARIDIALLEAKKQNKDCVIEYSLVK